MQHNSFKTYSAKPGEVEKSWYIVDAENQVTGRLASRIASILRGKHKPQFTPHVDVGDFVIVINADKVRFSGSKETEKHYFRHTGYPGGGRTRSVRQQRQIRPEFIIENAVKGMLPHNSLGRKLIKKLKVYSGSEHPHAAQMPQELEL